MQPTDWYFMLLMLVSIYIDNWHAEFIYSDFSKQFLFQIFSIPKFQLSD